jgi:hypothetical protein
MDPKRASGCYRFAQGPCCCWVRFRGNLSSMLRTGYSPGAYHVQYVRSTFINTPTSDMSSVLIVQSKGLESPL